MGRLRKPRVTQPQYSVGLNYSNPLTNGLLNVETPNFGILQRAGSPGFAQTPSGLAYKGNGAGFVRTLTVPTFDCSRAVTIMGVVCGAAGGTDLTAYAISNPDSMILRIDSGNSNAAKMRLWYRSPGNDLGSIDTNADVFVANVPHVAILRYTLGLLEAFVDGRFDSSASGSSSGTPTTQPLYVGVCNLYRGSAASFNTAGLILGATWLRGLSNAEIASISANPNQLFAPIVRRVFVAASSSGSTAALTGSSVTTATGALGKDISLALTGNSVTTATGALGRDIAKALTGNASTSTAGNVGIQFTVTRTEEVNGAEVNWFAVNGDATTNAGATLTGNSVTTATGTLGKDIAKAITGNAVTTATGTVTANVTIALTGNSVTTATGTLGKDVSKALTGNSVTTATGTLSPTVGNTAALTGNSVTTATGALGRNITVALTGNAVTTSVGTPSPSVGATVALTGNSVTTAVGALGKAVSLAVTGLSAATSAGTIGPGVSLSLVGRQSVSAVGTLTVAPSGFNPASTYQILVPVDNFTLLVPTGQYDILVPIENATATVQLE